MSENTNSTAGQHSTAAGTKDTQWVLSIKPTQTANQFSRRAFQSISELQNGGKEAAKGSYENQTALLFRR